MTTEQPEDRIEEPGFIDQLNEWMEEVEHRIEALEAKADA